MIDELKSQRLRAAVNLLDALKAAPSGIDPTTQPGSPGATPDELAAFWRAQMSKLRSLENNGLVYVLCETFRITHPGLMWLALNDADAGDKPLEFRRFDLLHHVAFATWTAKQVIAALDALVEAGLVVMTVDPDHAPSRHGDAYVLARDTTGRTPLMDLGLAALSGDEVSSIPNG